jgi:hypothetical protein
VLSNFLVIRKLAGLELRINQLSVEADLEAAAVGRNEDEAFDSGF